MVEAEYSRLASPVGKWNPLFDDGIHQQDHVSIYLNIQAHFIKLN